MNMRKPLFEKCIKLFKDFQTSMHMGGHFGGPIIELAHAEGH